MAGPFEEGESTHISVSVPRVVMRLPRAHLIEVVAGPSGVKGKRLMLDKDALTLGRAEDVELQIDADQLSRRHLQLVRRHGEYICRDLDSRNGVFLNGLRIHAAVLRDGDQLQLGDVVLVYREGA